MVRIVYWMYAIHLIPGIVSPNCKGSDGVWKVPVIRQGSMHLIVVIVRLNVSFLPPAMDFQIATYCVSGRTLHTLREKLLAGGDERRGGKVLRTL